MVIALTCFSLVLMHSSNQHIMENDGVLQVVKQESHEGSPWPVALRQPQRPLTLYLQGSPTEVASIGHSFMTFHYMVRRAVDNFLTLRSTFTTGGHGLEKTRVANYMFGDLFMAPQCFTVIMTVNNVTTKQKKVGCKCKTVRTDPGNLAAKVEVVRELHSGNGGANKCFIFSFDNPGLPPNDGDKDEEDLGRFLPQYRRLFEQNEHLRRTVVSHRVMEGDDEATTVTNGDNEAVEKKEEGQNNHSSSSSSVRAVRAAVHIRGGDLFQYFKGKRANSKIGQINARLIPLSGYVQVMKQLLEKLQKTYDIHRVHFSFFCEGGFRAPATLLDADQTWVDVKEALQLTSVSSATFDDGEQNVTVGVAGALTEQSNVANSPLVTFQQGDDKDALRVFDDMCFSDVVITGASGFSYTVSNLCSKPLFLATPFWLSYEHVPNAIILDTNRTPCTLPDMNLTGNLITEMRFDEARFESLWSIV